MTLEWRNADKTYGDKKAVDHFSLEVSEGELLVLIGPSGCGKTTSLKMINRLVEPSSGSVFVDGKDVAGVSATELRRHIGYVIQQVGLFPHMTVADNVAAVPRLLKWDRDRISARVKELLDLVGLPADEYAGAWPSRLSGGEAQRVGVARALAADPPILLMDEPFGAVDPLTREVLQREFLRIQSTLGKTVVFVTHDLDEAIRLGDRIAVMNEGRLVAAAAPGELLLDADPFIRDFTGEDRALRRLARLSVGAAIGEATPIAAAGFNGEGGTPAGSVRTDATLKEALSMMLEAGETSLEAVSPAGRRIGKLTLEDLLESAAGTEAS
ncbi:MAG: ABC transporter ATP-binding protein [Spirochaetaceae bacterium]|nr:ABC transporter ATP-binding protein [Spirochaetaceae bacterium]